MSLRAFLTRLIWLCVLPLLLLAAWLAVDHVNDKRDELRQDAERLARTAVAAVDQHLAAQLAALQVLAASPLADDPAHWPTLHEQARAIRQHLDVEVALVTADGRARFHTRQPYGAAMPPLPQPWGDEVLRRVLASGRPEASEVFDGPVSGEPVVTLAAADSRHTPPRFAIVGVTTARLLTKRLAAVALPPGWSMQLRDAGGRKIASVGASPSGAAEPVSATTTLAPWSVVVEHPEAATTPSVQRAAAAVFIALIAVTAVAVLGGTRAARVLSNSIASLAAGSANGPARARITEVQAVRDALEQSALALQLRESQLAGIVRSASDAIVTADETQTIVMANDAAALAFRCRIEDLVGRPLDTLVPASMRERHRHLVEGFGASDVATRPMRTERQISALRADGTEFPADASISHVRVDGRQLYTVILRDITDRLQAEKALHESRAELEASHAELQRLVASRDTVQEEERARIARELHDDLQQSLGAILMEMTAARGNREGLSPKLDEALERIGMLATSAIVSTRSIIQDLRPPMLQELGLVAALQQLAGQFSQRHGLRCTVDASALAAEDGGRRGSVATCVYRAVQEALNNVARHAAAREVRIRLTSAPGPSLQLTVTDDGRGLAPDALRKRGSFGVLGMRERIRAAGGTLRIEGAPGQGTTVTAVLPLPPPA